MSNITKKSLVKAVVAIEKKSGDVTEWMKRQNYAQRKIY